MWEQGRVDLDAPANDYLTGFRMRPARPDLQPATLRHLLTHTAGGYWRRLSDLLSPVSGAGIEARHPQPLGEYYRRGSAAGGPTRHQVGLQQPRLRRARAGRGGRLGSVCATTCASTSSTPWDGAHRPGQVRTGAARLANGYLVRSRGLVRAPDREIPTPGGGGLTRPRPTWLATWLPARRGSGRHDRILQPSTVAQMFSPTTSRTRACPGWVSASTPRRGRRTAPSGRPAWCRLPRRPDDGAQCGDRGRGPVQHGGLSGQGAPTEVGTALLRQLIGLPEDQLRDDVPPRPDVWAELCGWYAPPPGPVTNLFA